jgi:2-polyprenyl-3-methyl-5-hydroxy-6-metoxy-1,4-benzoquinol methylase
MSEKIERTMPKMPFDVRESLDQAADKGLFRVMDLRPQAKVLPTSPKIAIVIPCGDKDDPNIYECPHCKTRQIFVKCAKCGEDFDQRLRVRRAGMVPIEMMANPLQLVLPLLTSVQFLFRKSILSAQARNEMTWQAIENGAKYIAYWDDDTLWPPKALYDMHNIMERHPEAAIVTGIYTTREDCQEPLVYKTHGQGAHWDFVVQRGIIEPIFGAGAGCMMARVEALIEMRELLDEEPWWLDTSDLVSGKGMWGHDIRFCKRMHELTAKKLGIPLSTVHEDILNNNIREGAWQVYLAAWIQCGHLDVNSQTIYGLPKDSPHLKKDINKASYWNHVWESRGHGFGEKATVYMGLYDKICEIVPEGSTVVDVGCGVGVLMDMLAKKKQSKVFGIDVSNKAIEMVKSRWMDGVVGDAGSFHVDGNKHVVVSTETIEHLNDEKLHAFMKEASHSKMAIFSTPDGHLEGTPEGEHVQVFDTSSLKKMLGAYFKSIKIMKVDPHFLLAVCSQQEQSPKKKRIVRKKGEKK